MIEILDNYLSENTNVSQEERGEILECFVPTRIQRNEYWLRKGEVCNEIAFVVSGILRFINEVDGEETTMHLVFKDSFTASLKSLVFGVPSIWSIQSLTDCEMLIISRENHLKFFNKYRSWLELDSVQLLKAYTDLENRVFSQFHLTAEQRYNQLFTERPEVFNAIPLKHIASYLGITPETLSRLRKKSTI